MQAGLGPGTGQAMDALCQSSGDGGCGGSSPPEVLRNRLGRFAGTHRRKGFGRLSHPFAPILAAQGLGGQAGRSAGRFVSLGLARGREGEQGAEWPNPPASRSQEDTALRAELTPPWPLWQPSCYRGPLAAVLLPVGLGAGSGGRIWLWCRKRVGAAVCCLEAGRAAGKHRLSQHPRRLAAALVGWLEGSWRRPRGS